MSKRLLCICSTMVFHVHLAFAWGFDSSSDGSDGAFNPLVDTEIDLSLAVDGPWDSTPGNGNGVYDADRWAVVFKYTTINIPSGVNVTFRNHPSGAPIVWLGSGDVTISGIVRVNGANGSNTTVPPSYAEPGPGGFAGGRRASSSGFGPGGGSGARGGGGYGTFGGSIVAGDTYGNDSIIPLTGGSGGTGSGASGGAGGGAILIASSTRIALSSANILAEGGNGAGENSGSGSGGAIRLIAETVEGSGNLRARGGGGSTNLGAGGMGRIRVEADEELLEVLSIPAFTSSTPGPVFPPAGSPTLRATVVDAQPIPADPDAGILTTDVEIDNGNPVTLEIEATNIPAGTTVEVRVVRAKGNPFVVTSTPLVDAGAGLLTATAEVTFPAGRSEVQLRANWTP